MVTRFQSQASQERDRWNSLSLIASLEIMQWHFLSILLAEATKICSDSKGGNKDLPLDGSVDNTLKEYVGWNTELPHPSIFGNHILLQEVTARSLHLNFPLCLSKQDKHQIHT